MLITQPALLCLRSVFHSFGRSVTSKADRPKHEVDTTPQLRAHAHAPIPVLSKAIRTPTRQVEKPSPTGGPQEVADLEGPLTVRERRARAAALRGLALSRTRRFSGARDAFIEASTLDPHLDLTRIPMFWSLERAAHEAAIDAYQATGRYDEATVLRAQVRTTYRPRPISRQSTVPAATASSTV